MNVFWSFYRLDTGEFTGRRFSGPEHAVEINTPSGCGAKQGSYDKSTYRVDLQSGLVVVRERPRAEVEDEARRQRASAAQAHIRELEQRQARPLRELLVDPDNADARARLADIDAQIVELRTSLAEQTS